MNDFNVNGYLGEEIHSFIAAHKEQYKIQYSFNEILIKYFIDKTLKLKIRDEDARGAIIGCLTLKILNACQGVVIISQYGLDMEAHAILRTAFESYVYLSAVIEDDSFYDDYRNTTKHEMKKILNTIKAHPEVFKKDYDVSDEKVNGAKKVTIREAAKAAKMLDEYDITYNVLCAATHPDIIYMEDYFLTDENDTKTFHFKPSVENLDRILFSNCAIIVNTLSKIDRYFKLSLEEEIALYTQLLHKTFPDELP